MLQKLKRKVISVFFILVFLQLLLSNMAAARIPAKKFFDSAREVTTMMTRNLEMALYYSTKMKEYRQILNCFDQHQVQLDLL